MVSLESNELILSIVIPTKNRYDTLNILVQTILNWGEIGYEVIVQDNSKDNSLFLPILNQYKGDKRLKYYHTQRELSAIENCDLAAINANGKFLCFIGDDDGIVEQSIIACKWMENNNVDVLCCKKAGYIWPDMEYAININKTYNGKLQFYPIRGILLSIDAEVEYIKVLKSGGQELYNIPRLYHGFVAKKALNALYKKTSSYFPGPVPDMSNAIGLVPFVTKCYYTDIPLVISGHSKKSMSGRNAVRQHQGEVMSEKSIPVEAHKLWSNRVPLYWSVPTIWAEAAIKAVERVGRKDDLIIFNYTKLYAYCFAFSSWRYYIRIFKSMKYNYKGVKYLTQSFLVGFFIFTISCNRAMSLFLKIISINKMNNEDEFGNINEVINFLEIEINKANVMSIFK